MTHPLTAEGVSFSADAVIQSPPVDLAQSIPYSRVQGRTVLITGGASGIGAATALRLAEYGANVVIGDLSETYGRALTAKLRALSGNEHHHFVALDVTSWESQVAFFKVAQDLSPHGGIDCVIACAGINDPSESEAFEILIPKFSSMSSPPAPRMKTLQVDLVGVLYTATLAISYLSKNPGSQKCSLAPQTLNRDRHLVLVSSVAGTSALAASTIYATAKHGVVGLFRGLRISVPILHGVRVNMVCPQYVQTPILDAKGNLSLLGLPKTELADVSEAMLRLVADQRIVGRALLASTRATPEQVEIAGLGSVPGRHAHGAIWDIYGHDFEQTDLLMRRTIALLNLVAQARGWFDMFRDLIITVLRICVSLFRPLWK